MPNIPEIFLDSDVDQIRPLEVFYEILPAEKADHDYPGSPAEIELEAYDIDGCEVEVTGTDLEILEDYIWELEAERGQ